MTLLYETILSNCLRKRGTVHAAQGKKLLTEQVIEGKLVIQQSSCIWCLFDTVNNSSKHRYEVISLTNIFFIIYI